MWGPPVFRYFDNISHIKFNKNPFHNMNLEKSNTLTSVYFLSKQLLKIGTANAICWNYLGLFRDYGLDHICFRDKTFFHHLFETEFCETSQNQTTAVRLLYLWLAKKPVLYMKYWHGWLLLKSRLQTFSVITSSVNISCRE